MMNDRESLKKIMEKVMFEPKSYNRMKKINVLEKLLASTNKETGKLCEMFIIPLYEHDTDFLKETLKSLGYLPIYKEEYNHFYETTCYTVKL